LLLRNTGNQLPVPPKAYSYEFGHTYMDVFSENLSHRYFPLEVLSKYL
jgi:hypothetical protein